MAPPLHPQLEPLSFLVGTWRGEGRGDYPTIAAFAYREEITFSHVGKPVLAYAQRTWSADDGSPLHSETGYWRPRGRDGVEVVLAHPFGVTEIDEGTVEGSSLRVRSTTLAGTSTGSEVDAVARTIEVSGDVLRYTLDMAAGGRPLQRHLVAELHRVTA